MQPYNNHSSLCFGGFCSSCNSTDKSIAYLFQTPSRIAVSRRKKGYPKRWLCARCVLTVLSYMDVLPYVIITLPTLADLMKSLLLTSPA